MQAWNLLQKTTRKLQRQLRQERGQSLVEFALVLPVLLLIILGILYFGRYEQYANEETQMASEAARSAAVNFNPPGTPTIQAYIQAQAQGELVTGSSDVTAPVQVFLYYPTGSSNAIGNSVRACVLSTTKYPSQIDGGASAPPVQTATMRIEQLATNWTVGGTTAGGGFTSTIPSGCPSS
jgi:Flp pilus assembly protein TadG